MVRVRFRVRVKVPCKDQPAKLSNHIISTITKIVMRHGIIAAIFVSTVRLGLGLGLGLWLGPYGMITAIVMRFMYACIVRGDQTATSRRRHAIYACITRA